jgi:hypothetical protein
MVAVWRRHQHADAAEARRPREAIRRSGARSVRLLCRHIPVPESVAVNTRARSYKILANVEITDPNCSGVIFANGSRFGGHALFIKDKKLHYVYNFLGINRFFDSCSRNRSLGFFLSGAW